MAGYKSGLSADRKWFTDEWSGGICFSVRVNRVLREVQSPFQHVLVLDTPELGRMLVIDGCIQCSEADEAAYHELLVHPGLCRKKVCKKKDQHVLVIGGGDGGSAREALRHENVCRVDLVDIDPEVTKASKELLTQIWRRPHSGEPLHEDPRLSVYNEDGLSFLESGNCPHNGYDLIVVDATDPSGPGSVLYSEKFYNALESRVSAEGAVALQAGSWFYLPDVLNTVQRSLNRIMGRAEVYNCWSAVYPGGVWNLVLSTRGDDPSEADESYAATLKGCMWYNFGVHRAAFCLYPEIIKTIGKI